MNKVAIETSSFIDNYQDKALMFIRQWLADSIRFEAKNLEFQNYKDYGIECKIEVIHTLTHSADIKRRSKGLITLINKIYFVNLILKGRLRKSLSKS